MEIVKEFGIKPILLVAQIVNFLVILYILRRFFYKPVTQLLKKREDTIKEGLEKAEEARIRLEKVAEEEKKILKEAQSQAIKIIDEAKTQGANISKKAEEETLKQIERMITEARNQIAQDTKEAQNKLTAHVSKLAIAFLQKSVSEVFNEKTQDEIMSKAIKRLKGKTN